MTESIDNEKARPKMCLARQSQTDNERQSQKRTFPMRDPYAKDSAFHAGQHNGRTLLDLDRCPARLEPLRKVVAKEHSLGTSLTSCTNKHRATLPQSCTATGLKGEFSVQKSFERKRKCNSGKDMPKDDKKKELSKVDETDNGEGK